MKKFFFFLLIPLFLHSQERKIANAYKFLEPPKIDGIISKGEWDQVKGNTDFVVWFPETRAGDKLNDDYKTTTFVGFDNEAIYIAAILIHPNTSKMPMEFSQRDKSAGIESEAFWVSFNTFDDNLNYQSFEVTPAGAISDMFSSGDFDPQSDYDYDTVFEGYSSIDKDGWYVEMRIPYSALRFPKKNIQEWGINFGRHSPELDSYFIWNYADPKNSKYQQSFGLMKGLKDITPPARLFFYPYFQISQDFKKGYSSQNSYSAGLDLKYGLGNSFTLDATLIPDFGQVTFDDKELNLSPFEQQFDENRPFFMEGASLFEKADGMGYRSGRFFYSRRIGEEISFNESDYINANEELIRYDNKPELINSTKISGTTDNKLSIGILNAVTGKAYAYFRNTNNQKDRKVLISPLTNYNVISLSQQVINEYSSISLLNTSVIREGGWYDSNNQAIVFDMYDNPKKFNFKSTLFRSYLEDNEKDTGFRGGISINKLTGSFRYGLGWNGTSSSYTQNDLGIIRQTNNQRFTMRVTYQIFEETKLLRTFSNYLFASQAYTYDNFIKKSWGFRQGNNFTFQNLMSMSLDFDYTSEYKDFDETRTQDRFIIEPENFEIQIEMKSDGSKRFSYGFDISNSNFFKQEFEENKSRTRVGFFADFRYSDRLSFGSGFQTINTTDDIGYLKKDISKILFGKRDIKSIENNFEMLYNINTKSALSLKLRNFWSVARYSEEVFSLRNNGRRIIEDQTIIDYNPNTNFNLWNFDLNFEWWFAPGSNMILLYRNQVFNQDEKSYLDYNDSVSELFNFPLQHQISLRINYFLDYNRFKKK